MKKNNQKVADFTDEVIKNTSTEKTESSFSFEHLAICASLIMYLLVNFLPKGFSYDISGVQWLGISVVNILVGAILLIYKKDYAEWNFLKVTPTIALYTAFMILSSVSIYAGENQTEGFASLIRMMNTFIPMFYIQIFSQKKINLLKAFSVVITIILFLETATVLDNFLKGGGDDFIVLAGNAGNINIFASNIILKLPFVIYLFFALSDWKKYLLLIPITISVYLLFQTSSRTNIINLAVMMVCLLAFLVLLKKIKENIINVIFIAVVVAFGYGLTLKKQGAVGGASQSDLKIVKNNPTFNKVNLLTGNRLNLWNNSYILAKRKPLTGIGLGNYKIEAIPLESKTRAYWGISKYSHNDFMQVCAESGFITGFVYLGVFIIIFFGSLRQIFNKENDEQEKWIAFIVFISIICFGLDSIFNFPLSRPITQIHFLIIIFWFLQSTLKNTKVLFTIKSAVPLILLFVLNIVVTYYNNLYHKSLVGQNTVMADERDLKLSFAEVDAALPNYPNLMEKGYAVETTKARYLVKEERLAEAVKLLNSSKKVNKHYQFTESVLAEVYGKLGTKDSVQKYWKSCFEMFPHYKAFYINNLVTMKAANNQVEIDKVLKFARENNGSKEYEQIGFNITNNLPLDYDSSKQKTDTQTSVQIGKNINAPNTKIAEEIKALTDELTKVNKQNWPELLRINGRLNELIPNHPPYLLNIGMSLFKLNKQAKAKPYLEKVIASNFFKDGLPEFVLGVNYLTLNDKINGCKYVSAARAKNYVVPENIAANCK